MKIKFNPTGTHIHKRELKVRLDIFPDETCQTYSKHYVCVPVIPDGATDKQMDNQAWLDALPHIWKLNPMLCAFVTVKETISTQDVLNFCEQRLTPQMLKTLDANLSLSNYAHRISAWQQDGILVYDKTPVQTKDFNDLVASTNLKLEGLPELNVVVEGGNKLIDPQSIDIGPGAIDRTALWVIGLTIIDTNIAASGTGTIDTWELWFYIPGTSVAVATFIDEGGNNLSTRDSDAIGTVASGSKQTFSGLSTAVSVGDLAGVCFEAGAIERDSVGSSYYKFGNYIPCSSESFGSAPRTISIYGTGTEGGAGSQTLQPSGIASLEAFGALQILKAVQTLEPEGIVSAETFGELTMGLYLVTEGIISEEAFGTAWVKMLRGIETTLNLPIRSATLKTGGREITINLPDRDINMKTRTE